MLYENNETNDSLGFSDDDAWYLVTSVTVSAGQTVTFEIVTLLGAGLGGLTHAMVIE